MKEKLISQLSQMRRDYAKESIGHSAAKGSFETLAGVLGVPVNTVMVFFLMFTVVIIEIGMAVTAGKATEGVPGISKKPVAKVKNRDQIFLPGMAGKV